MSDLNQSNNQYPNQTQAIGANEPINQKDIKQLFNKFFVSRWYLYVYTLSLSIITAYFYNWYSTPIYSTSCTVLIKEEKHYNSNDLFSQLNAFSSEGGVDNEIGIIRSRQLIYKALSDLDFGICYYVLGDVKTSEVYKENPIKINIDTLFESGFRNKLNIEIINDKKFKITYDYLNHKYIGYYLFSNKIKTLLGDFSIEKTTFFKTAAFNNSSFKNRNFIIIINQLENITDSYQSALKADKVSSNATLLQLSIQGNVPSKNEAFLNRLCELYIQKGIAIKNEYAVNTIKFIDEQLGLLTSDINVNEKGVEEFRVRRGITDLSLEANSYLEAVKDFDYSISKLQVQLSFLDYLERYVTGGKELSGNISPGSLMVDDPLLKSLILKLNELENKRKLALSVVKADNPILIGMNIEIQNTKAALVENLKSLRNGLTASLNEALLQKGNVQGKLRLLPGAQRELQTMLRGSNIKETLYSYLLQKRAETAILLASTTADNRVVDVARTFPNPLKPIKSLTFSIAILLGLLIPAIIIYTKDILNDKINDRFDLDRVTSIPILGMIGLSTIKSNLVVSEKPNSHISEAFRSIRTNMQYFNANKLQNTIMVTSSISSEGKSFCSINLAVMLAMSGKKTILVSCDLRKPKNTLGFNYESEIGLSNYLIGIATKDDIIQNSGSIPNLDIILSGPKPPNPSELIISKKMEDLFTLLKAKYSYIVLDTPPIGLITDAMVLSKYTDMNIYVVRQGITRKTQLNFINKLYLEGKISNVSIILNAIKAGNRNYGYGYEYAYGYGYGYGYYEEDDTKKMTNRFSDLFQSKNKKA